MWLTLKTTLQDDGKRLNFASYSMDFKRQNLAQGETLENKLE